MWLDQFLVALDVDSGAKVWQRAIDTADGDAVMFLAHGQGRLVLVSSGGPPTGNKTGMVKSSRNTTSMPTTRPMARRNGTPDSSGPDPARPSTCRGR